MKAKIDLSIVVPCYNCAKFIDRTVKSIIDNSYDETEIILINDGSIDNTKEKLINLSKKYKNITVIDKENSGVSDTRNYGIDIAKGKYIGFVDSDDIIVNNIYKKVMDIMKRENPDVVCFIVNEMMDNKIYNSRLSYKNGSYDSEYILREYLKNNISISVCDKVYKNELVKNNKFSTKIKFSEDILFCVELFQKPCQVYLLNEVGYLYVQNANSMVHTVSKSQLQTAKIGDMLNFNNKKLSKEYNYFIAYCMARCIHHLSYNYNKKNKDEIYKYFKEIYDKDKVNILIKSKYSSTSNKLEFSLLKIFGIKFHLNMFFTYRYVRNILRKSKLKENCYYEVYEKSND